MKIAFRVDASLLMGSGHVMRCLTLADALKKQGADCHFVSREHQGHLLEVIQERGFEVHRNAAPVFLNGQLQGPHHAAWLGCSWQLDADQTSVIVAALQPDWLVVDHYALDHRWEEALAPHCRKLLVIDDLADRAHHCDLLLDQNLGRQVAHYDHWVPAHCRVLAGPQYALLRPEFAALRPDSLRRRQAWPALQKILVSMGGVDQPNATGQVLQALETSALPADCRITVVMGPTAIWVKNVKEVAAQLPWPTEVVVNANNMAQRMADSDLAIGAAGSTSWERCCMGLPCLMVVLADNQRAGAQALEIAHAALLMGSVADIATKLPLALREMTSSDGLGRMSLAAGMVCDGQGVHQIIQIMEQLHA